MGDLELAKKKYKRIWAIVVAAAEQRQRDSVLRFVGGGEREGEGDLQLKANRVVFLFLFSFKVFF